MPQPFNNAVMTNDGAALLMKAQAGLCKIKFTRVAIGSGVYADEEKTLDVLQKAVNLKTLEKSYAISSLSAVNERTIRISALISNQDPLTGEALITSGFYINEMGIFAGELDDETGTTEILYSIAVTSGDQGDFMPPFNGYYPAQIIQDYYITVNNSAEVTVESSGAVMLVTDGEKLKKEIEEQLAKVQDQMKDKTIGYDEENEALIWSGGISGSGGGISGYTLPIASKTQLGGVLIGSGISIDENGKISFDVTSLTKEEAEAIVAAGTEEIKAAEVTELYKSDD